MISPKLALDFIAFGCVEWFDADVCCAALKMTTMPSPSMTTKMAGLVVVVAA